MALRRQAGGFAGGHRHKIPAYDMTIDRGESREYRWGQFLRVPPRFFIAASLASHWKYRVSLKSDHESTPVFAEASGRLGIALFRLNLT
jgi:hypothetical protein